MAEGPRIVPGLSPITPGPTQVTGQGQNPPAPQIPAGTTLAGSVVGMDGKGNPIVQTEALQLVLSTRFPLQTGQQVALRLEQGFAKNVQPHIRIVNVDGKTPAQLQAALQSAPRSGSAATPPPLNATGGEASRPVGVLLEAIAHKPGAPTAQSQTPDAKTSQQPASAPVREAAAQVRVSGQLEAVLLRPAASPKVPEAVRALLPQGTSASPTPMETWLKPGLQLQVRVANLLPQQLTTPSPATPSGNPFSPPAPAGYAAYAKHSASATPPQNPLPTPAASATTSPSPPSPSSPPLPTSQTQPSMPPASTLSPPATQTPPSQTPSPQVPPSMTQASASPASLPPSTPPGNTPVQAPQQVQQALQRAVQQGLPPMQLPAIVVGSEKSGAAIIQTQLGSFSLPQNASAQTLQPGTMLHLEVKSVQLPEPAANARMPLPLQSGGAVASASQLTAEWSALSELVGILQSMQSSAASQALQRVVPHIGSNMTAGMVFFLAVIRKGDVTQWLGKDLTDQLEQMGKSELIQRLGADLSALRTVWGETQPQTNWQALFFPVMVDKQMQQARLFVKREPDDKKKSGGTGTRFVVEVELSHLGAMQFDGLVKKREGRNYFDLVIRTLQELGEGIKHDIQAIFQNAQEVTGIAGNLYFRCEEEFPINPLEELQKEDGEGGHGSILA